LLSPCCRFRHRAWRLRHSRHEKKCSGAGISHCFRPVAISATARGACAIRGMRKNAAALVSIIAFALLPFPPPRVALAPFAA